MKKMKIAKKLVSAFSAVMFAGIAAAARLPVGDINAEAATTVEAVGLKANKKDSTHISLKWSETTDKYALRYIVDRYDPKSKVWRNNYVRISADKANAFTDKLSSSKPRQFKYRVRVIPKKASYKAKSSSVWASNIKVCVDPGHYAKENYGSNGYYEGDAVLKIAKYFSQCLKYEGIDYYMTRTGGDIKVGGKVNVDDSAQLRARGLAAKKKNCDYFISLHTNANNNNANDRPTCSQPNSLNKTIVFINTTGNKNSTAKNIGNRLGLYVTEANKTLGIPTNSWRSSAKPVSYTDDEKFTEYNDGLKKKGSLIYRTYSPGQAYYAVIRAADEDKVPGFLVEHSYHTVPTYCKAFMKNTIPAKAYGLADARAIAHGLGFGGTRVDYYSGYKAAK